MKTQQTLELTDANFNEEVLERDRTVLVDFWAPWCGPCLALGPTIEQLAEEYEGTVDVGKLNVDDNPETAHAYGISSIPSVLVFRGGEVVKRLVGIQPKERYEAALRAELPRGSARE